VWFQHTSPAKGEPTTPRNRKRHYDSIILTLFLVFHNSKFSAYARGSGGDAARLCVRFLHLGSLPTKFERSGEKMNIFKNESEILGGATVEHLKHSFEEFFQQAVEIRTRLGVFLVQ
jgi:hypothetical protein